MHRRCVYATRHLHDTHDLATDCHVKALRGVHFSPLEGDVCPMIDPSDSSHSSCSTCQSDKAEHDNVTTTGNFLVNAF